MARSHRFGKTILGVGVAAYYQFHDEATSYEDFTALYSHYLQGPALIHPFMPVEEQQRLRTLNWRVWGKADATRDEVQWGDPDHPAHGALGLWGIRQLDLSGVPEQIARDGALLNAHLAQLQRGELDERTIQEVWARNVITDNGATAMLKNLWNNAGSAVAIMDHLVIAFGNQGYATQTGSTINNASGAQTSIACGGGVQVANLPANGKITWSYGTSNAETWTLGASAPGNLAATSITVTSQTVAAGLSHVAGDYIVNNPTTSDNPSSLSNSADSGALASGAFTFSGSGAGNRQVAIQYTFPTSTTAGAYTEAYTSNAGTIASNSTASHLIFPPQTINGTTSLQFTATEKC